MPVGLQYGEGEFVYQNSAIVNFSCVQDSLRSLWDLDFMGLSENSAISNEEKETIECFERGIRLEGDRYSVGLLWKSEMGQLENNFEVTLRRFKNLRNRLNRNPEIFEQYKNVIEEQIKEGIVEECSQEITESSYFMPHREIIKPNETTSCRIVYDASSYRSKGVNSLNDILDVGPNLSPLVLDMILKFRKFEIAFSGDIAKAFLMIGISEKDRDYLKFLWFGDNEQGYKTLRFKRLPFGLCCSPVIFAMTIKYHIKKYKSVNPECSEMLNSSLYVDDLYYGSDTIEDACRLSTDAVNIFKDAGMDLRKLRSNSEKLNSLWIEKGHKVGSTRESKFLGKIWISKTEVIKLNCAFLNKNLDTISEATKRIILQTVASVYDPIGVSQPFLMKMKILLQKIWTLGLDWDEALPPEIKNEWILWRSELNELERMSLPRKYFKGCEKSEVSLHVFADASPEAYGAVAYFRYLHDKKDNYTSFIAAKGRVAPLKPLTLPRLELMAALVAAKLAKYLTGMFPELCKKTFLWSDSQITLHWIKGNSRNWKPFVANRVSEIQTLTDPEQWFHCSGKENPADLLSRGESAVNLVKSSLWSHGPSWLSQSECDWPMKQQREIDEESVLNEKRSQPVNALQVSDKNVEIPILLDLFRFSRLLKVYRITAYVMRFINNIKRNSIKLSGQLSSDEILNAELHWVKIIQRKHFEKEISDLSKGKLLEKTSSIYSLNPFVDEQGFLRLKGRLHFSDFEFSEKHPCLLPYKDQFSQLVILDSHNKLLHAGVEATLTQIREKFWIIKGRQCVKSILNRCSLCKRYKVRPGTQETAPLPPDRVLMSPPFSVTGLDYAGPFFTKGSNDKHYLLLFTCATTRALHLELVPSMNTEQFLLAFRRFISRRGLCSTIYSDNAKTFKCADVELKKLWKSIRHPTVQNLISSHGIKWKYIVEKGAWWGGFWERHFRTIKTSLRKIVGRSSLSLSELETLFIEIEAMINSRPITYIYDDPSEPSPLIPAHFLIGKRLLSLPVTRVSREELIGSRNSLIKRHKHQQNLLNHFWYRWRKHYLLSLRSMNICPPTNVPGKFKVNDVVLVHDDRHPRNMWTMGKIIETHPGRDGKIRSCLIKTANGNLRRPVQLLYNLEINNSE
ncbi:hypothetical protein AVEN_198026-1 [Araneus ventricosus]|uniref:Integrase catalytic domain-containing protein n=1 Tax=Araneus ventricosus TaxID=182803 RepID=A0A4Y2DL48_ARAVE|nr:hypothetical protein AVEN_36370-1 [Araneus ventricosus]GBM17548.1 hypothetical protein AVEN_198026-1 [Araneus ventricosus]